MIRVNHSQWVSDTQSVSQLVSVINASQSPLAAKEKEKKKDLFRELENECVPTYSVGSCLIVHYQFGSDIR